MDDIRDLHARPPGEHRRGGLSYLDQLLGESDNANDDPDDPVPDARADGSPLYADDGVDREIRRRTRNDYGVSFDDIAWFKQNGNRRFRARRLLPDERGEGLEEGDWDLIKDRWQDKIIRILSRVSGDDNFVIADMHASDDSGELFDLDRDDAFLESMMKRVPTKSDSRPGVADRAGLAAALRDELLKMATEETDAEAGMQAQRDRKYYGRT